ncbi:MAG: redoxin domain-containing protein [Candidatus Eisenbacteria bacterium]|nr:redoxin domain-containing protein [Candidatus Latescibacterota bacterium]MBD3301054.1 redoxin domain-containing protein [Candidatus Eisenbacteria bacterium]
MQSETRCSPSPIRIVLLALLCAGLGVSGAAAIDVGDPAPEFLLVDLDGLQHSPSGYTPNPVLLMFFESGTSVSNALGPAVQNEVYDPYVGDGLRILGIECTGKPHEHVDHFRNQSGILFPLLLDGESVQDEYGLPTPSFVLIGGGGTVRYVSEGTGVNAYDRDRLTGAIEESLRESNETKRSTWGLIKSLYTD